MKLPLAISSSAARPGRCRRAASLPTAFQPLSIRQAAFQAVGGTGAAAAAHSALPRAAQNGIASAAALANALSRCRRGRPAGR